MVYVLAKNGQPLMPTNNHRKVRLLLEENKAMVVRRTPFTIKLLVSTNHYVQNVSLGVDAGSKHIGLSATTESQELYAADVTLRNDIVENLSTRREFRTGRRYRKTRYRKPRFNNRGNKKKGWLAPSVQAKINSHKNVIEDAKRLLPISKIIIETASFDIQKLKADLAELERPKGTDYQQGEQMGFWNAREYVLFRDGHLCQNCKGKSGDKRLNAHHIESRKIGGDAPNNLVTLCETCHDRYHQGLIKLPDNIKRGAKFSDAAFMGIMRWALYDDLKVSYLGMVSMTFGYITKNTRITNNLEKTHAVDARCISGNPLAKPLGYCYMIRKVRCHNRQLHKAKILKGGIRKNNQAPYTVHDFRLFDKVLYNGQECFICARRTSGYFDLRLIDNTKISASASYKKLRLLETRKNYIVERKNDVLLGY